MKAVIEKDTIGTITTHYIDGAFVESNGREVMDIIKPTNGQLIGRVVINNMTHDRQAPWGGFKYSGEPKAILE